MSITWKFSHAFVEANKKSLNRKLKIAIVIGMSIGSPIGILLIMWMVDKGWIN